MPSDSNDFIEEDAEDFLLYWLNANSRFVANHAGKKALPGIISAIELYREANPGMAVEIRFLPQTVRMLLIPARLLAQA